MMKNIMEYRKYVNESKQKVDILNDVKQRKTKIIKEKEEQLKNINKARWVLSEVSKQTQINFKYYVEDLMTLALKSVFKDRDFKFKIDFNIKRNKPECVFLIQEGEEEPFFPKDEMGGGIRDLISFVLRIVFWSLQRPRTRNIIILDEPFKRLGKLSVLAGEMVKEISQKLNLQIIIITHNSDLIGVADRCYKVKYNGKFSEVTENLEGGRWGLKDYRLL